jgi:hypothetical protein
LKASSLSLSAVAGAVLTAAIVAASMAAQAPQPAADTSQAAPAAASHAGPPQDGPGNGQHRELPAPTNLKVLPKTLTGKQVRDIMEGWSGALGVHCDTCHTPDPTKLGPNGRPRLNFADDSKPQKNAARLMVKMTTDANDNYVSMVNEMVNEKDSRVTCGTCHRGHLKPEAYIPPKEHDGPRPPAPGERPPAPR